MRALPRERLRVVEINITRGWVLYLSPWVISMAVVEIFDQELTILYRERLCDEPVVEMALIHQQLLEYLLAHYLFDQKIRLLEVRKQNHEHLL